MVKNKLSFGALLLILLGFLLLRSCFWTNNSKNGYNTTTWDALGYYMYLPGEFIYNDVHELSWLPKMDSSYHLIGGNLYQAIEVSRDSSHVYYTGRYLTGVAIMQSPFFLIGHKIAQITDAPEDGFSWPYQYAIVFAALFWACLGFLILRKVLLRFFDDTIVALVLLLIAFASNLVQYVVVDAGMSHAYIFPLYAAVVWFTVKWHERPSLKYALMIGLICGLAVISRPTEIIIIFIPLLWNTHEKEIRKQKWKTVWSHKSHLVTILLAGVIALLPQLFYWKYSTGKWLFDVGSKWYFLNPWFRVLVGPEKGWFLYTPLALFMIWGLFKMKNQSFRRSVLTFCILNIWIIIAWADWRYGASFSCRALTQSYPVFALPLACWLQKFYVDKFKKWIWLTSCFLILFNMYEFYLYNFYAAEGFSPLLRGFLFP